MYSRKTSLVAIISFGIGGGLALTASSEVVAWAGTSTTVSGKTLSATTNIRSGPNTSTSIVGHVSAGTSLSGTAANGWLHITSGSYSGKYVSLDTLKLSTASVPSSGSVTFKTIYATTNIRTAANTSATIASRVNSGTSITGTLTNGWIHITAPSNLAGKYVSTSVLQYVSATSSSSPSPHPSSSGGGTKGAPGATPATNTAYKVNSPFACTTNPAQPSGACGQAVQYVLNSWMIRTNAAGANLLTVSGSYGTTTAADVKVFQAANGLSATGNMDAATWKALSKASNSTNSTLSSGVYGKAGDTHPAFPSSIKLEDGRLMMVFTSAQHHLNNTQPQTTWKTYSSDGGYTWTKPVQIVLPDGYETTPAGLGIATSGPLKGHPILTTWSKSSTDGVHTKVTISADLQGNAWGELTDINSAFPGHQSLSASPIVQVDDTNFQQAVYVYAGQDGSSTAQTVGLTYDGTRFVVGTPAVIAAVQQGATPTSTSTVSPTAGTATSTASQNGQGQAPAPATPGTSTSGGTANTSSTVATNSISSTTGGFTESGMVKLPDGRLFALMRNDLPKGSTAAAGIYSSYSSDGGKTWTPPVRAFDGSGAPRVTVMSNGNLVVLYRKTDAKNPSAEQNSNAVYRVSTDNGVTWGAETSAGESAPFEMAYGTPIANSDGTVTFVYANETNGNVSHMVTTPNVKVTK